MAETTDETPDDVVRKTFYITMASSFLFCAAVFLFIL